MIPYLHSWNAFILSVFIFRWLHFQISRLRKGLNFWRLLVGQWMLIFVISNKYVLAIIFILTFLGYVQMWFKLPLLPFLQGYELLHQMEPYINQVTLLPTHILLNGDHLHIFCFIMALWITMHHTQLLNSAITDITPFSFHFLNLTKVAYIMFSLFAGSCFCTTIKRKVELWASCSSWEDARVQTANWSWKSVVTKWNEWFP